MLVPTNALGSGGVQTDCPRFGKAAVSPKRVDDRRNRDEERHLPMIILLKTVSGPLQPSAQLPISTPWCSCSVYVDSARGEHLNQLEQPLTKRKENPQPLSDQTIAYQQSLV